MPDIGRLFGMGGLPDVSGTRRIRTGKLGARVDLGMESVAARLFMFMPSSCRETELLRPPETLLMFVFRMSLTDQAPSKSIFTVSGCFERFKSRLRSSRWFGR